MSETKLANPVFDKTVQQANIWIKDLMQELGIYDADTAYHIFRATLHSLRDRLLPTEAIHLGAQLPMILRGSYYEGWKITDTPVKLSTKEEFFSYLEAIYNAPLPMEPEAMVRAVFKQLNHWISAGEIDDVKAGLPEKLRELWPE